MEIDPLERLKRSLGLYLKQTPASVYVDEMERRCAEDDIFNRLAFKDKIGGSSGEPDIHYLLAIELYNELDADQKREVRKWWHSAVRTKANGFDDLRRRLQRIA